MRWWLSSLKLEVAKVKDLVVGVGTVGLAVLSSVMLVLIAAGVM